MAVEVQSQGIARARSRGEKECDVAGWLDRVPLPKNLRISCQNGPNDSRPRICQC